MFLNSRDLGDSGSRSGRLNLAVTLEMLADFPESSLTLVNSRHLADWAGRGAWSSSDLSVWLLRRGTALDGATTNGLDVDRAALATLGLVVQVVEVSAQALVEDSLVAEDERAVVANSPARGVDRIGLEDVVELELVVGDDLTSAAVLVLEDTVVEGDLEGTVLAL